LLLKQQNYDKLEQNLNKWKSDKDVADRENVNLKAQLKVKQAEIDRLKKDGKQKPASPSLIDKIERKIVEAYNSPSYLLGTNINIMKTYLSWEYSNNEELSTAVIPLRSKIKNCLSFLENKKPN
jgi:hypothetical protein